MGRVDGNRKRRQLGRANFTREETGFESTPRRWIYFFKPDNEEGNAADTFSRKINDSRGRFSREDRGAGGHEGPDCAPPFVFVLNESVAL